MAQRRTDDIYNRAVKGSLTVWSFTVVAIAICGLLVANITGDPTLLAGMYVLLGWGLVDKIGSSGFAQQSHFIFGLVVTLEVVAGYFVPSLVVLALLRRAPRVRDGSLLALAAFYVALLFVLFRTTWSVGS